MSDELKVFPDEDGNCPAGYHLMQPDDSHDMRWCMEGEEHPSTYSAEQRDVPKNVDSPKAPEEMKWDGDKARVRVRNWASDSDGNVDWDKYAKAFGWYDGSNMDVLSSYKLPHHDIVDGEMKVVYHGVVAAKGAMAGARGGVDLPDDERTKVQAHLNYHLKQFDKETDKATEIEDIMLTTIEEKETKDPEQKRLALFDVTIEKDTKAMKPRTVVARISTTSIDRDGEVLLPSGIDLKDFRKNPVVLLNHDQGGLPVGRALSVKRQSDGIIAEVQFAERPTGHPSSVEWIPDTIFNLFQQGILKAFSVGFIPLEMREPTDRDFKKFGDDVRNVISKWSLLEFSVVNVPSNQDSLVMQVAKNHKWLADAWQINSGQMQENTRRNRLQLGGRVARLQLD